MRPANVPVTAYEAFSRIDSDQRQLLAVVEQGAAMVQLTTDTSRADAHRFHAFYARLGLAPTHVGCR